MCVVVVGCSAAVVLRIERSDRFACRRIRGRLSQREVSSEVGGGRRHYADHFWDRRRRERQRGFGLALDNPRWGPALLVEVVETLVREATVLAAGRGEECVRSSIPLLGPVVARLKPGVPERGL